MVSSTPKHVLFSFFCKDSIFVRVTPKITPLPLPLPHRPNLDPPLITFTIQDWCHISNTLLEQTLTFLDQ